jgi:CheY-like chemotaxis protein
MIDIELNLADDLRTINGDPAQIEQALMNLAVNARDAMPEGGRLRIGTKNVTLDEEYCRMHLGVKAGDYVLLSVTDTGYGMNQEILGHLFEPFYTTKGVGRGTGLGLSMVYGIVRSHDGYIFCDSVPGKGTTFEIYLPVIEQRPGMEESKEERIPRGGKETILLIDDEEFIRHLGNQILRQFGYIVLTASDGESGLELYQKEKGKIDLVILDLIMPGMGGRRCLEELLRMNPKVKVVIASGYSVDGHTKEALEAGAKNFVSKPYAIRQMLKVVREVLDKNE